LYIKECLSATALSKKTAVTLDSLSNGETGKLLILKNNQPKAILLSIDTYEAMEEEMEDLRLATLGLARLINFQSEKALSHKEMMQKFAK